MVLAVVMQGRIYVKGGEKKELTTMSPTSPYSSHNMPNSNSSTSISVCACERRPCLSESRSPAGAVHLTKNCQ